MGITVITPPATEPVSLADAKAHLRVDTPDDDQLISGYISTARMRVESATFLHLITQTLQLTQDRFPWAWPSPAQMGLWPYWSGQTAWPAIELEPPVQSVTSVSYLDPSGNSQTLSSSTYRLDSTNLPARLTPTLNNVWPATAQLPDAVTVVFVAGFGNAAAVPANLIQAVKLLVGHYYLNREQILSGTRLVALEIPEGFDDLVRDYGPSLVA